MLFISCSTSRLISKANRANVGVMAVVSPTSDDLRAIVHEALGAELVSAERFPTGLCHYVYDAVLADGRAVVLRLARPENRHYLRGGIHWSNVLRPLGIPLPELLYAEAAPNCTVFPYMILERLPGQDLGAVYSRLTAQEKAQLAYRLAAVQEILGRLPEGKGFGFQSDPGHAPPYESWGEAVEASIQRSERWIEEAGVVDGQRANLYGMRRAGFQNTLRRLAPSLSWTTSRPRMC